MSILDFALEHARQGRLVFPGAQNSKLPAFAKPYEKATRDEAQIIRWWTENPNYNICLPGGYEIAPGKYLGFIDVDLKDGRDGFATIEKLEAIGLEFPETLAQTTPTNGVHLFYYFDSPIRNGVNSLGLGIDTRGFHGYVIGAGSGINGKGYVFKNRLQIAAAPDWIVGRCKRIGSQRDVSELGKLRLVHNVDEKAAEARAAQYLRSLPTAQAGERNRRCYEAACKLKDLGLSKDGTLECMSTNWRSEPAVEAQEIEQCVNSAFRYGQNAPGVDNAEVVFDAIPPEVKIEEKKPRHPIDVINDEFCLVVHNGVRILRESKDRIDHLTINAFHDFQANNLMTIDDKSVPVSKMWMKSKHRRQYDGIVFAPNNMNPRFFNVWRGFSVSLPDRPPEPKGERALYLFLEHIRENVCGGDLQWARWILGFFAHLIQKPEDKPGVALVLRGRKGVGKNVITDCIFRILGDHGILAANRRYLSGNFNAHLENKLMLVLDEAFWSGDKLTEGVLKDLITGSTHQIERKGHDSYQVANLMRVVIFGNEEWIVPATDDERRFAVFNVGDDRRGDREFFGEIKDGMRDFGGDQLLFKYLKEFDLSKVDVNVAPETDALMGQKEHSLGPVEAWWLGCLRSGYILGTSDNEWPTEVPRDFFRSAFYAEAKAQNINGRLPNSRQFGKALKNMAPSCRGDEMRREGDIRFRVYTLAPLEVARQEWEKFINGRVEWE